MNESIQNVISMMAQNSSVSVTFALPDRQTVNFRSLHAKLSVPVSAVEDIVVFNNMLSAACMRIADVPVMQRHRVFLLIP